MKLFGWRMCHNWLPAKTNLKHRGMDINTQCESCGRYDENLTHALWNCDKIKKILKLLPWYKKISKLGEGSMFDVLQEVERQVTRDEFEDTIKVLWAIWENRNRKWNQLPSMNGQQLLNWVFNAYPKAYISDLTTGHQMGETTSNLKHWIPPENGCICVNSDAAINENTAGVGLGFVWRTASGHLVSAGMVYMPSMCSVKMAEGWALLEALKNPPAVDTSQIEVQTNCKVLVADLKFQGNTLTTERNIIHKLNRVLENFNSVHISHVKRTNNECVNLLARKCLADKTTQFFDNSFPDWLAMFCKADHPIVV
ncbi:hypothetical protein CsatA_002223 [Cannabis sativa]